MRIVRHRRGQAALLAVLAGCYSPVAQEGAPCDDTNGCPIPQRCVVGRCSLRGAPAVDASLPEPDAPPDAPIDAALPPIDAMRLPCEPTGLSCGGGGSATTFMCGGNCWVVCTGNVARDVARAACAGWMGALGEIDNATENGCVAPHVASAAWIGLEQAPGTATLGAGWTWNGTVPLAYTNWAANRPDDGSGNETGSEQCADIRAAGGQWDDDTCGTALDFFCERP
jgi:hypothetical protein